MVKLNSKIGRASFSILYIRMKLPLDYKIFYADDFYKILDLQVKLLKALLQPAISREK